MSTKIIIVFSAILALFAGAILISEVPSVATLVAFLEVCAGFGCGFYYSKYITNEELTTVKKENEALKNSLKAATTEKKVKFPAPRRTAKSTTTKSKEEKGE